MVTELGNLNAMGVIGSQHVKGQVASLSFQGVVECLLERKEQQSELLTHADLWYWLGDCDVPGSEIDKKLTKF